MSFDTIIDHENRIVCGRWQGPLDVSAGASMTREVRKRAFELEYGALYDVTEANPQISLAQAYSFSRDIKSLYEDPKHRMGKAAIVHAPGKDEKFWRFFETTARNAGIIVKLFQDKTEAMAWLSDDSGM